MMQLTIDQCRSHASAALALDSILADCQHGFQSQRSCETQLVQFDKVLHKRLLHKLDYYGIRGSTHKWINSWLSGRTQ